MEAPRGVGMGACGHGLPVRIVVQRVRSASVVVDGEVVGAIGRGLVVLVGVGAGDGPGESDWLAAKVARLRVFPDGDGRMNRSLLEVGGEALVVSQFTLLARVSSGTRPSYSDAALPDTARALYERFGEQLAAAGVGVQYGRFGAAMELSLHNDGPVTLVVDRAPQEQPGPSAGTGSSVPAAGG